MGMAWIAGRLSAPGPRPASLGLAVLISLGVAWAVGVGTSGTPAAPMRGEPRIGNPVALAAPDRPAPRPDQQMGASGPPDPIPSWRDTPSPLDPVAAVRLEPAVPDERPLQGPLRDGQQPLGEWDIRPLQTLAPAAVATAAEAPAAVSVMLIDLTEDTRYGLDPDRPFRLASVGKVAMMLPPLATNPDRETAALIAAMIERSDNDAATALWRRWGPADVRAALAALGLDGVSVDPVFWGRSEATAEEVAILLAAFVAGDVLPSAVRDPARAHLESVIPAQTWGITAGLPAGWSAGLKNGWNVHDGAWLVHSAGYLRDGDGAPRYVLAILSAGHPNLERGIAVVEAVAREIHAALADRSSAIPWPCR